MIDTPFEAPPNNPAPPPPQDAPPNPAPPHDAFTDDEGSTQNAQLSLFVNLDGFEGPIDLLLALAREQKVDLSKIAILPLAEQYLHYISSARELNLEIAADYLVMAAWLAYLKSRLLLPEPEPEPEVEDDIIDMSDALRFQLVRLEAMQTASKRLMDSPRLGYERFVRGMPEYHAPIDQIVWQARLYDLLQAYGDIRSAEISNSLTIAATRLFSVQEAATRLARLLPRTPGWTQLEEFLPPDLKEPLDRCSAMAAHFVASLELAREGVLSIRQLNVFSPIFLKKKDMA